MTSSGANEAFVRYNNNKRIPETVSEAHGYGMVISAYMCNKQDFDAMYNYFRRHPSSISPDLMAWKQRMVNKKMTNVDGADSATDGDLDIAYALLLAHDQWGSAGNIKYRDEALKVIRAILQHDVNAARSSLKVGDWAEGQDATYTRPSDFMLDHLIAFKRADPANAAAWKKVYDVASCTIKTLCKKYGTCLMPDFAKWVGAAGGGCFAPVPGQWLESPHDSDFSYNSCRTPWRIASAYVAYNKTFLLNSIQTLSAWAQKATNQNPKIKAGYYLNGTSYVNYDDLAFTAPFAIAAMTDTSNPAWFNKLWSSITSGGPGSYKAITDYYADTIRMQVLIMASNNWWVPA